MGVFSRMFDSIADTVTPSPRERRLPMAQSSPVVSDVREVRDDSHKPNPATGPRRPMVFVNGFSRQVTSGAGVSNM